MLRKQPTTVLIHLSLGFDELLFGKFIRHAQPPEVFVPEGMEIVPR